MVRSRVHWAMELVRHRFNRIRLLNSKHRIRLFGWFHGCILYSSASFRSAIRMYRPFLACLKYAARGSASTSVVICARQRHCEMRPRDVPLFGCLNCSNK